MCAIVASFDIETLLSLIELNSYRGSSSYSFSTVDPSGKLTVHQKSLGVLDSNTIKLDKGYYGIVHIQAPTTDENPTNSIHPAVEGESLLWHNGIVKAAYVKQMQDTYGHDTNWDTQLLLRAVSTDTSTLSDVDGSFSCLWYDGNRVALFRNDISPMFFDKHLNISSTKFKGSMPTPSNKILRMDFSSKALYTIGEFETANNPYFFGDFKT